MTRRPYMYQTLLLLLLTSALGCGDDGGSTAPPPPGDTTPPSITSVTGLDAFHVEVVFDETVDKASAEHAQNYTVVETTTLLTSGNDRSSAPGDSIAVVTVTLGLDQKTCLLTLVSTMGANPYRVDVRGVRDRSGNRMTTTVSDTFTGSSSPDVTAPEIVGRTPGPNGVNVGIGESVVIQFSELMDPNSVVSAFSLMCDGDAIAVGVVDMGNTFIFAPLETFERGSTCTAQITNAAQDFFGNNLTSVLTTWDFTTNAAADAIPPALVSTTPSNGATSVSVNAGLSFVFSEAIDPSSMQTDDMQILVNPDVGDGLAKWSSDRRTLSFDPDAPLEPNTFYFVTVAPGAVSDVAGNGLADATTVQFTTSGTFPTGRLTGTITGDSQSSQAGDPTGMFVIATTNSPFSETDDDIRINGIGVVAGNNTHSISRLPDSWYFPVGFMDSNGDGRLDPEHGDAVGAFGVDFATEDFDYDSVLVSGGSTIANVNFTIFDPVAISGSVQYPGAATNHSYFVGVFDTTGFDTTGGVFPDPNFGAGPMPLVWEPYYALGRLDGNLDEGTYFVGAFLDLDNDMQYDPATDPAGFFEIGGQMFPVTVVNGADALNIDIVLSDPAGAPLVASAWRARPSTASPQDESRRKLLDWVRRVKAAIDTESASDR